ncbi:hypothetical protein B0T26DRAFT_680746 [Lasiosphaeria miniovina]|uniref:Uncharacterized protein n=1 Tax=Lasiosphaeria miniovina TaxID=1954250 RepID=A0AA40DGT8_9PEZI|nr:uncharacterized protein B0T26DRAFT_680746 [Lasiosphaeria miniovina]KAK0702979.1 hypothetical protein B0T26DRAFT_680746 [Lasiosphaeria miniovina]
MASTSICDPGSSLVSQGSWSGFGPRQMLPPEPYSFYAPYDDRHHQDYFSSTRSILEPSDDSDGDVSNDAPLFRPIRSAISETEGSDYSYIFVRSLVLEDDSDDNYTILSSNEADDGISQPSGSSCNGKCTLKHHAKLSKPETSTGPSCSASWESLHGGENGIESSDGGPEIAGSSSSRQIPSSRSDDNILARNPAPTENTQSHHNHRNHSNVNNGDDNKDNAIKENDSSVNSEISNDNRGNANGGNDNRGNDKKGKGKVDAPTLAYHSQTMFRTPHAVLALVHQTLGGKGSVLPNSRHGTSTSSVCAFERWAFGYTGRSQDEDPAT